MISLQNLANSRFSTFASFNNSGKWLSQTKPQDCAMETTTATTQSWCTTLALMATVYQRTETKVIEHLHTRMTLGLLTKDLPKTTSEAELRIEVAGEAKAHTHQDPYTACIMAMKSTIVPKTAPSTSTSSKK
jgi:hypothetical protein